MPEYAILYATSRTIVLPTVNEDGAQVADEMASRSVWKGISTVMVKPINTVTGLQFPVSSTYEQQKSQAKILEYCKRLEVHPVLTGDLLES